MKWCATILDQPRSKANSRRILKNRRTGKMFSAKNENCLDYAHSVHMQALVCRPPRLLLGPLSFKAVLFYPNRRSDLDPSLLIDSLQGAVFKNDRQIVHMNLSRLLDKDNPRAEIEIEEMEPRPD